MPVNIQVEVNSKLKNIEFTVKRKTLNASNILKKCALEVLSSKGGGRTGKSYKKSNSKASYTASAPGEPPARRTGALRNSWKVKNVTSVIGAGGSFSTTAAIETNLDYDTYLEHGTSKMAARPHHDKIKEMAAPQIEQLFNDL